MFFKNIVVALLMIIVANCVSAQVYTPLAPGVPVLVSAPNYFEVRGNYPTGTDAWNACVHMARAFAQPQAQINWACGSAPPPEPNTSYSHHSNGWWYMKLPNGQTEGYYMNIWSCPNSELFIWIPEKNECVALTLLGPRPTPKDNGLPCGQPTCGNPVVMGRGTKVQIEVDFQDSGPSNLSISRTYNGGIYGVVPEITVDFGAQWTFMAYRRLITKTADTQYNCYQRSDDRTVFCRQKASTDSSITISAVRPDGKIINFAKNSSNGWAPDKDISETLTANYPSGSSNLPEWLLTTESGDREYYDASGMLSKIERRQGGTHRYTYSDGTTNDTSVSRKPMTSPVCSNVQIGKTAGADRILCITDDWGRQLNFEYDEKDRVSKIIVPNGEQYAYAYDGATGGCSTFNADNKACAANNLTSVTYPDGKTRRYYYNEKSLINNGSYCSSMPVAGTGQLPFLNVLTGIGDENGARYASWGYNCAKQAISSEHAGGVDKVSVSYGGRANDGSEYVTVSSTVGTATNPSTISREYHFILISGVTKNNNVNKLCDGCGDFASRTYDTRGNVLSSTDWNGKITQYTYEPIRNLEISRVEAKGSAVERKISTVWHTAFSLPIQVSEPKRLTSYEYDNDGRLIKRTEQATSDMTGAQGSAATLVGSKRTWEYTYNAAGQQLTATGPRKAFGDTTTYTYDERGNIATMTNAIGHVITYSNYNFNGKVGRIVAPNGLITDMLYDSRGRISLQTVTNGAEIDTRRFEYDGVGQLTKLTFGDGSYLSYVYDQAHRLSMISDGAGNSVTFTLDNLGNRISEQTTGSDGILTRKIARVFDTLGNLIQVTGAPR